MGASHEEEEGYAKSYVHVGCKSITIVTSCFLFYPNHFIGVVVLISPTR